MEPNPIAQDKLDKFREIMLDESWFINGAEWDPADTDRGFKPWQMLNWFVFDTETTGLVFEDEWEKIPNPTFGIIQFYGKLLVNREYYSEVSEMINPGNPIEEAAQKAHGITDEDVADKPAFGEVAKTLLEPLYSTDILIAYNARFDIRALIFELVKLDWTVRKIKNLVNIPFLDPLIFERERSGKMSGNTLHKICKRFGVKTMGRVAHGRASLHDASTDTDALVNLMAKYSPNLPWNVRDIVNIQASQMKTQDKYIFDKYGPKDNK